MPESPFYSLRPVILLVSDKVLFCGFCKHLSKDTFSYRTPPLAASVKACNVNKIRLNHGCLVVNFLKISKKCFFDALQEFSKSSQKYWQEIFF